MDNLTWAQTAIQNELNTLANLPEERVQKPGSVFSVSLLKIASVTKGAKLSPSDILNQIQAVVAPHSFIGPNVAAETERQWKNAWNHAIPRYPNNGNATPAPAATSSPAIETKNPKTVDFKRAFEMLDYKFALNILDDTIECNGQPMNLGREAEIMNRMRDLGLVQREWVQLAWTQSAHTNQYHPIQDKLRKIRWDGQDRIAEFCQERIRFSARIGEFGKIALQKWLIGAVGKVMANQQNFMLVFDGSQGVGKSTLARWLCLDSKYFIEGAINPDDKDSFLRLATKLVWEVGELQATTRRADRESLKHFITTQEITMRKAYGRYDITKPAMCSLIGTINEDGAGFLTDPTGSRRFVIAELEWVDLEWIRNPDNTSHQLWGQAYHLWEQGETNRMSQIDELMRQAINAEYETASFLQLLFHEHFEVVGGNEYVTTTDILDTLTLNGLGGNRQTALNELGRLMKKLGVTSFRARAVDGRPTAWRGVARIKRDATKL